MEFDLCDELKKKKKRSRTWWKSNEWETDQTRGGRREEHRWSHRWMIGAAPTAPISHAARTLRLQLSAYFPWPFFRTTFWSLNSEHWTECRGPQKGKGKLQMDWWKWLNCIEKSKIPLRLTDCYQSQMQMRRRLLIVTL